MRSTRQEDVAALVRLPALVQPRPPPPPGPAGARPAPPPPHPPPPTHPPTTTTPLPVAPPLRVPRCALPAAPGSGDVQCMAYMPRWAWDEEKKDCVQFVYGGCGGNRVSSGGPRAKRAQQQDATDAAKRCARMPYTRTCVHTTCTQPREHCTLHSVSCVEHPLTPSFPPQNNFETKELCLKRCRWGAAPAAAAAAAADYGPPSTCPCVAERL